MRRYLLLGTLLACFALAGVALAQSDASVDWWIVGGGGGSTEVGGTSLRYVIGQWGVESGASGGTRVDSGFLGGAAIDLDELWLPLVLRGA